MSHQACELTIETALSDPIVMDVMAADGVDPKELSVLLYRIAGIIKSRPDRIRRGPALSLHAQIAVHWNNSVDAK
jgi:hypothetical protein